MLLQFPKTRHVRASTGSGVGRAAKASNVISLRPFSSAKRTKAGHRPGGMPRLRQPLTTESSNESASATAPVPPRSSMMELGVSVMADHIVRTARTCQEFAICETTFPPDHVPLGGMLTDPPEVIGPRLIALRAALDGMSQSAFAKSLHIEKNTYNEYEKGKRPLTFLTACKIKKIHKIPVEYLFWGENADHMPAWVRKNLDKAA